MEHLAGARVHNLALRTEIVNLIDDEPMATAMCHEKLRSEVNPELRSFSWHPSTKINDAGTIPGGHEFGHGVAGARVDGNIGMLSAKNDHSVTGRFPARGRLQSPPVAFGIYHTDRLVAVQ